MTTTDTRPDRKFNTGPATAARKANVTPPAGTASATADED